MDLYNNKITEIKGLENLNNLRKLDLESNQITEIKGLQNLTNLNDINISKNPVYNFILSKNPQFDWDYPQDFVRQSQDVIDRSYGANWEWKLHNIDE